jgi:predicted regulator of Ras-like GTPase activity (Roadblock/LC7/MglB family)/Flp pilus assembly protein TadD
MAFFGSQPQSTRLEELKRILQKDPTSRQFLALAEEYRRQGKLRDAIITLERGLQIHGTSVAAHVALGRSYQQLDRLEDATRAYVNALRIDRENLVAIRQLAEVYLSKGDKVEAIKKLKLYRGLKPGDKDVSELIAQIEVDVPALKQAGTPGVRPHPAAPPLVASPSAARLAALRQRAEAPRSGMFLESPVTRSASTPVPPPPSFAQVTATTRPPPDSMSPAGPSGEEPYATTPALEKMPGEDAREAPASRKEQAPELPPVPASMPEPRARARSASVELQALTYEMAAIARTVETAPPVPPAPPPAPPPPVSPLPAAEAESAPFEDVPAVAPPPGTDLFEAPAESFAASGAAEVPVLSPPAFHEAAVGEALEEPPTQPLFVEPSAVERQAIRAVLRGAEPPPAPLAVPAPELPPAVGRPVPPKLRALAARFPARSSATVEELRGCLQSLVAKAPGIRAATLTDMAGLPVLTVERTGERSEAHAMEILVAEMTSFLRNVRRTRDEVGEGTLTSLTLVGERGAAVVSRVSPDYSLILQVDLQAAIGEVRYEAARTARALRSAVG